MVLGVWLLSLAVVAGLLLAPVPEMPRPMAAMAGRWRLDLAAHALLFGWLMWTPHQANWGRKRRVFLSMGLTLAAAGLEAAQGLTAYRMVDLADAAANMGGILLGAWAGRRWGAE